MSHFYWAYIGATQGARLPKQTNKKEPADVAEAPNANPPADRAAPKNAPAAKRRTSG